MRKGLQVGRFAPSACCAALPTPSPSPVIEPATCRRRQRCQGARQARPVRNGDSAARQGRGQRQQEAARAARVHGGRPAAPPPAAFLLPRCRKPQPAPDPHSITPYMLNYTRTHTPAQRNAAQTPITPHTPRQPAPPSYHALCIPAALPPRHTPSGPAPPRPALAPAGARALRHAKAQGGATQERRGPRRQHGPPGRGSRGRGGRGSEGAAAR
jgi:hypothetical protein